MADGAPVKSAFLSKGVIGGIATMVIGALLFFGIDPDPNLPGHVCENAESILDKSLELALLGTGLLATIGRLTATNNIKFPWQKD